MHVQTSNHNIYSYLQRTNEIVPGIVEEDYVWKFDKRQMVTSMPNVNMLIIGITEQCNLRCTYCCYSGIYEHNRTHSANALQASDIDEIFDFIDKNVHKRPLRIAFYGGEPLMQYPLVQNAIDKAQDRWADNVSFSLSTNATLLTAEKLDWLIAHNIELYISIDGTAEDHNRYRLYPNGKGSFEDVHRVLQYIRTSHCAFLDKVQLMMTLVSIDRLQYIAQLWNEDEILQHIQPAKISALAPNFARGVAKRDYDRLRETYSRMLDLYEQHPEWVVLKAFFEDCIAYWYQRPIMQADGAIPMATCMPQNNKLYIDANKNIGVCEKMPDTIRIGSVEQGIKWDEANRVVETYYNQRICRCATCPVVRMCDLCLTAVDYTEKQWDILCHNERVYTRVHMWVFCEMAERGLIK